MTQLPVLAERSLTIWDRLKPRRPARTSKLIDVTRVSIISQTCDIVRDTPATVVLAPVVELPEIEASPARDGRRSRYVHLPQIGATTFIDLETIASAEKAALVGLQFTKGVDGDLEVRRLAYLLGRRFARFPFPDEIEPWLAPLREVARKKSGAPSSAEGLMFSRVQELRIEAQPTGDGVNAWLKPPYHLTLIVILDPGELPDFEEPPTMPNDLRAWLYGGKAAPSGDQIARRLVEEAERPPELQDVRSRYLLWWALAEAWAAKCVPKKGAPDLVAGAVAGGAFSVDLVSMDEFSLARYRRTESLDLDHLSTLPGL